MLEEKKTSFLALQMHLYSEEKPGLLQTFKMESFATTVNIF